MESGGAVPLKFGSSLSVLPLAAFGPFPAIALAIQLALIVLFLASYWKIFTKAGQPGWAAIIPIYNVIIYLKIVDRLTVQ